ncbi:TPA: hypothetical protein LUY02_004741, partial [Enterobacter hormaechei subsp. hoffmannii]|nr:hypothetical protein [Enterobacter hormaechei subsp. hoffmannii]
MSNIHITMINNRQGQPLAVQVQGPQDAPAIVFSNSLGTDNTMWMLQIEALKADFKIVTYDTRG